MGNQGNAMGRKMANAAVGFRRRLPLLLAQQVAGGLGRTGPFPMASCAPSSGEAKDVWPTIRSWCAAYVLVRSVPLVMYSTHVAVWCRVRPCLGRQ